MGRTRRGWGGLGAARGTGGMGEREGKTIEGYDLAFRSPSAKVVDVGAAYEALRTSPLLGRADAVVCAHPPALCEAWLPFNKSILLVVTTNLELARENPQRWKAWS